MYIFLLDLILYLFIIPFIMKTTFPKYQGRPSTYISIFNAWSRVVEIFTLI